MGIFIFFAHKARLQALKIEFFSDKVEIEPQINLQLSDKSSIKLDPNSSLLLEYDR